MRTSSSPATWNSIFSAWKCWLKFEPWTPQVSTLGCVVSHFLKILGKREQKLYKRVRYHDRNRISISTNLRSEAVTNSGWDQAAYWYLWYLISLDAPMIPSHRPQKIASLPTPSRSQNISHPKKTDLHQNTCQTFVFTSESAEFDQQCLVLVRLVVASEQEYTQTLQMDRVWAGASETLLLEGKLVAVWFYFFQKYPKDSKSKRELKYHDFKSNLLFQGSTLKKIHEITNSSGEVFSDPTKNSHPISM